LKNKKSEILYNGSLEFCICLLGYNQLKQYSRFTDFLQNLLTNKLDFDGRKSIKQSHKIVSFKCLSKFYN